MSEPSITMPLLEDTKIDRIEGEEQENLSESEESNAALVLPQTNIAQTNELRRSPCARKLTSKMLENLVQEAALKDKRFARMYERWISYIKDIHRKLEKKKL